MIHSDISQGFITAEVFNFDDIKEFGYFQGAKEGGKVRLEGKEYGIRDGDLVEFRFNI